MSDHPMVRIKLSVDPITGGVPSAKEAGARVVIVNVEPTEMDALSISATLLRTVGAEG